MGRESQQSPPGVPGPRQETWRVPRAKRENCRQKWLQLEWSGRVVVSWAGPLKLRMSRAEEAAVWRNAANADPWSTAVCVGQDKPSLLSFQALSRAYRIYLISPTWREPHRKARSRCQDEWCKRRNTSPN